MPFYLQRMTVMLETLICLHLWNKRMNVHLHLKRYSYFSFSFLSDVIIAFISSVCSLHRTVTMKSRVIFNTNQSSPYKLGNCQIKTKRYKYLVLYFMLLTMVHLKKKKRHYFQGYSWGDLALYETACSVLVVAKY